jgi:ketosteroid isomerase-like protein
MREVALIVAALVSTPAVSRPSDEATIVKLEREWRDARIAGDVAFLERFYAPELTIQGMSGGVTSRDEDIRMFRDHLIKPELIDPSDMKVRLYGDTAVVTGLDHMKGSYRGHPGELWLRFTDVLVRRAGNWRLVIQQATPAQRP